MSYNKFFPHEVVREGQKQLLEDINSVFSNQKILLAHAPTGLGKTAATLTVAAHHALQHDKTIFFLTNRHTQHRIALDTLKQIQKKADVKLGCVDLIGKKWMCLQEIANLYSADFNEFCKHLVEKGECDYYSRIKGKKGLTVEGTQAVSNLMKLPPLHNHELINEARNHNMCAYELALEAAKKANVIICDYYYIFNPFIQQNLFNKLGLEMEDVILIVDEGHNLPNRVQDMLSSTLSSNMLHNAISESKKFRFSGLVGWLTGLQDILKELNEELIGSEGIVEERDLTLPLKKVVEYDAFLDELNDAANEVRKKQRRSYLGGVAAFLDTWRGDDDGYVRIITRIPGSPSVIRLDYSCLDPSVVTGKIFKDCWSGVVMSGTLSPLSMYKDLLGIAESEQKTYASPFPPENKCSLIIPQTTTKFTMRSKTMFQEISSKCSEISSLVPGNVAFFFPSYSLRDQVATFLNDESGNGLSAGEANGKKLFWEKRHMSKEEKETMLKEFIEAKGNGGGILLAVTGANFAEGVDFPGDALQGVVVVGLPLAKPDLKTKAKIQYYEQKFNAGWDYGYVFPAMNKCLQSAGRCIRSGKDRGAIIYLDERFAWQQYYRCFDSEGLIVSKDYGSLLNKFFNK